ncbi:hypothetical protein LJ737_24365 [Hymenobacter sp. 15J16-1T3B]|uniref:hypothetical protein n=1 Tax=Hymenobacter sp. 15J16-1T3B TaxID=2886941 RepID=UPI001D123F8B|nr:hypothetical protein [Hymenobacter sp. 15J16-1T3B]MCC3160393.1 hypothetical protein [Hymenobacter sp. 15J16-1T3B]
MDFHLSVSLTYKEVFDDYEAFDLADAVSRIPSRAALEVLGYVMAQLHTKERSSKTQLEILRMWLSRIPDSTKARVEYVINKINKEASGSKTHSGDFNFVNNVSTLKLIQEVFNNFNNNEDEDLTPEQELLLFKSYLYVSQKWTDEQADSVKGMKAGNKEEFAKFFLNFHMPYIEHFEFKDFRMQIIKAIYFFRFCESNPQFKTYLEIFILDRGLNSWQEYLVNILKVYVRKFEPLKTPSIITFKDAEVGIVPWLKELSINESEYRSNQDFRELREKPVFEVRDNEFVFLNLNFLIDKIYQGIQFDFAASLVKHKAKYNGKRIKDYPQFKSIYGEEFSEKHMFYAVMKYCFRDKKLIKFSGEELRHQIDGEPDFYIRDKAKIYVFECKDVTIAANAKQSPDVNVKIDEVFKKLVKNEKGADKGVTQLVNTIKKIRSGEFLKIDAGALKNSIIYPIIVHIDFSLQVPGINVVLNSEFRRQIAAAGLSMDAGIKNVSLLHLDTLIKFQDLFNSGQLKINNCLNSYYELSVNRNPLYSIASLDNHLHDKAAEMNYDSPKIMMEELEKVLSEVGIDEVGEQ